MGWVKVEGNKNLTRLVLEKGDLINVITGERM